MLLVGLRLDKGKKMDLDPQKDESISSEDAVRIRDKEKRDRCILWLDNACRYTGWAGIFMAFSPLLIGLWSIFHRSTWQEGEQFWKAFLLIESAALALFLIGHLLYRKMEQLRFRDY